ncbi:MAG: N-6 DNA methylase [Myxococcales bacterium]|nr:SAM-dependent methyltransferase [Polyangiaceae bacterium]MDW8251074.1 N-6 DNA methylase [Myxococcales bacterium]
MKLNAGTQLLMETGEALGTTLLREGSVARALAQGDLAPEQFAGSLLRAVLWLAARSLACARGMLPPPPRPGKKASAALWDVLVEEERQLRGDNRMIDARLLHVRLPGEPLWRLLNDPLWREASSEVLGECYEELLSLRPHGDGDGIQWLPGGRWARKHQGSYYTRPGLRDTLLDGALEPLLSTIPMPSVCDPSCGSGNLLAEAARRIARRAGVAPAVVVEHCLYGVDVDPLGVELCRLVLWLEGGFDRCWPVRLDRAVHQGDSLLLPWKEVFPEATMRGGFDCVVGNPPFVNCVEGPAAPSKAERRRNVPEFGGTADLAYLLLGASMRLVHPQGRLGMIQPRALLSASPARSFRKALPRGFRLVALRLPESATLFPGAAIHVCQVFFARSEGQGCSVCFEGPQGEAWFHGELRSDNWWSEALRISGRAQAPEEEQRVVRLGERFQVMASMTAQEAYEAVSVVIDREQGDEPRLLTTGLIEPGRNLWGQVECRFLGRRLRFPRLPRKGLSSTRLLRRIERACRPKILVAGLSRVVECFLDLQGEYIGSVSTYTILHPEDNREALGALCERLLSSEVSERFRVVLGGSALGGGNMTMTKEFLRTLPLSGHPEGL